MNHHAKATRATVRTIGLPLNASRWISAFAALLMTLTAFLYAGAHADASSLGSVPPITIDQHHRVPCDDTDGAKADRDCCFASAACTPFIPAAAGSVLMPERVQEGPHPIADAIFDDLTAHQFRPPRFSARA